MSSLSRDLCAKANIALSKSKNLEALSLYKKALKIDVKLNDFSSQSIVLSNIGLIYLTLENNEKALKYFISSLKICQKINDSNGICIASSYIGDIYKNSGDFKSALTYYKSALNHFEKSDWPKGDYFLKDIMVNIKYLKSNMP